LVRIHSFAKKELNKPMVGSVLKDRYYVMRSLSENIFGQTFLVEDAQSQSNQFCVVKQLKPHSSGEKEMELARCLFEQEEQVLYELGKHNQIPKLLAHFEENNEFFLVHEYIVGHTLEKEIKRESLQSETQVIELLREVLEVLSFAHEHHVIHRDIKPSNLMRRDADKQVVLTDFGAVKQICRSTSGDTFYMMSSGYVSAEQIADDPKPSSDVYSVGVIGIQALTGINPNELEYSDVDGEIIWNKTTQVSEQLSEIIEKMTRLDYRQRFQNADEALQALNSIKIKEQEQVLNLVQTRQEENAITIEQSNEWLEQETQQTQIPLVQTEPTNSYHVEQPYSQQFYPSEHTQSYQQTPQQPYQQPYTQNYQQPYQQQPYQQPYQQSYPQPQAGYAGMQMPQQPFVQGAQFPPSNANQQYYNVPNRPPVQNFKSVSKNTNNKSIGVYVAVGLVAVAVISILVVIGFTYRKNSVSATESLSNSSTMSNTNPVSPDMSADEETFKRAEAKAAEAQKITQTAQFSSDWDIVASNWEKAIDALRQVQTNSPRYEEAQKKITEYAQQLENARTQSGTVANNSSSDKDPTLPTTNYNTGGVATPPSARSDKMYLSFSSSKGDYIGGGKKVTYTQANGTFTAQVRDNGNEVVINFNGGSDWWSVTFAAPKGQKLSSGGYNGAQRAAFHAPNRPGLDFDGSGRGCNTLAGSFVIKSIEISNNVLLDLDATFTQQCGDDGPPLYGRVRYHVSGL